MILKAITPGEICIGVVGLGLMGSSIIVSLLKAGHKVIAVAPLPEEEELAPQRIYEQIAICKSMSLLDNPISAYLDELTITQDYRKLSTCQIILECVVEKMEIKEKVYRTIEEVVDKEAVIASNTSAIAITALQRHIAFPERFLGIHWAEPSYATRFLEITCGAGTNPEYARWIYDLAYYWDKEPTLLKKDIHGFITNRLMYAVCREALHLVEDRQASLEDVDKAFRYDAGSWMTLMGVFRRMDYLGLKDYAEVFKNVFPALSNSEKVPEMMQRLVDSDAKGVQNSKGLYQYANGEAADWEEAFKSFNGEIYKLAVLFPADLIDYEKLIK